MDSQSSSEKLFVSSSIAEAYSLARPKPPQTLLDTIISFMSEKLSPPFQNAVDVGCGSGQSTTFLSPHFTNVLGTDVSAAQINEAAKRETNPNVQYKAFGCETIPLPDSSTELITAAEAAHWFNMPSFYKEVDRVLVPGGVLALYCHSSWPFPVGHPKSEELANHIIQVYKGGDVPEKYWHKNRDIADDHYASMDLPYAEQSRDFTMNVDYVWSVADYIRLIKSWSFFHAFSEKEPEKAKLVLSNFEDRMMKTLNVDTSSDEAKIKIRYVYYLIMARKPI